MAKVGEIKVQVTGDTSLLQRQFLIAELNVYAARAKRAMEDYDRALQHIKDILEEVE